jgi:hypothetical protein
MSNQSSTSSRWCLAVALLLTAFKLWLTRSQPIYAIGPAAHDERLFLQLANNIVNGEWLGAYTQMTLAKGSFYSLFVAAVFWVGMPLFFVQQLLYAGACAVFSQAFSPSIRSAATRLLIYAFLLWSPMTYEAPTMGRVMRQHVYVPLGIMIFAGLVALYHRREQSVKKQAPWAAMLGFSIGGFWLTREESIWIGPSFIVLVVAWMIGAYRSGGAARNGIWRSALLVTLFAAIPVSFVSWQNYRHYGWFGTGEFHAAPFKDAYGAMVRVKVGPELAQVPVTRQAREAMYAVSPTFAKLQPFLDGQIGSDWSEKQMYPAAERQIRGGWFVWALRDCVVASGHGHNAGEAMVFYRDIAREINQACDDGRLPARSRRSGFAPVLHAGEASAIMRTFFSFYDFVIFLRSFNVLPLPSIGDNSDLQLFRDMTRDRLSISERATNFSFPAQEALDRHKFFLLDWIGRKLCSSLPVLFFVTAAIFLVRAVQMIINRKLTYPFVLSIAAVGGVTAYLLINAIVHVTSFPLTAVSTFSPIYPLVLIFMIAVTRDAWVAWLDLDVASKSNKDPT